MVNVPVGQFSQSWLRLDSSCGEPQGNALGFRNGPISSQEHACTVDPRVLEAFGNSLLRWTDTLFQYFNEYAFVQVSPSPHLSSSSFTPHSVPPTGVCHTPPIPKAFPCPPFLIMFCPRCALPHVPPPPKPHISPATSPRWQCMANPSERPRGTPTTQG